MPNPSEGWKPEGWAPTASQASQRSSRDYTLRGGTYDLANWGGLGGVAPPLAASVLEYSGDFGDLIGISIVPRAWPE